MQKKISHPVKNQPFLERPRLDGLLETAVQYPLVMVTAGAGYGKTRAVDSFLQHYDAVTIWVQLSGEDNLAWRFWEHYTGNINSAGGDTGTRLAELGFPETLRQFDRYMALLYDDTRPRKKYVTVFDDFHFIRDPAILSFFNRILAAPPLDAATILISRTEPALNTVSLLSRGVAARITMDELRFSQEEIGRYFQGRHIALTGEELVQIHQDTDGWALAVNMIAQDLRNGKSNAGYIPFLKSSFRKIADSLFNAMEDTQQQFLIKLSLLDYWPLELLDQMPEKASCIAETDILSSFIRYDTYLQGYRIHHLFMDFLREKQNILPVEKIREVYTRAAEWCLKNKLRLDAAVNYARAGNIRGLLLVINSLPRIPPQRVAVFLLDMADRILSSPDLPPDPEEQEALLFLRHIIRPKLLMCLGRFDESTEMIRKTVEQFEALPPGPQRSRILHAAYNSLGVLGILTCRYTRDYGCAVWFERAYHYYLEFPEPIQGQITQSNLGSYIIQVGPPAKPGEVKKAVDSLASAASYASMSLAGLLDGADALARAELAYYQADLSGAEKFARQAVYQSRAQKQYEVENRGLFYLMRISVHSGSFMDIEEFQRRLEAQLDIPEYLNRYTIHDIGMGRFYAQLGLTGKIAPWIRNEYEEGELNALFHNFNILVRAWCLFAEKQYDAVLQALKEESCWRELESLLLGKLEKVILEAAVRYHLGEEDQALAALEAAYLLAAPNSLDMPFIEMGKDMLLLVEAALSRPGRIPQAWLEYIRGRASAYHKKLVLAVEQYLGENRPGRRPPVYLTRREREVLSGLARGLTRKDIAVQTGLSLNTVRSLISVIYQKLGAVNRADAIRLAINLGFVKTV